MGTLKPKPKNSKVYINITSLLVNLYNFKGKKSKLPLIANIYEIAHNTKKDPICVHITK